MLITQRVTYVGYALHDGKLNMNTETNLFHIYILYSLAIIKLHVLVGLGRDMNELTKEQKEHRLK